MLILGMEHHLLPLQVFYDSAGSGKPIPAKHVAQHNERYFGHVLFSWSCVATLFPSRSLS